MGREGGRNDWKEVKGKEEDVGWIIYKWLIIEMSQQV